MKPRRPDPQARLRRHRVVDEVESQVFVLPCVVATDCDRDMLPNSLEEAMAMQLPFVTSDIAGVASARRASLASKDSP